MVYKGLSRIRSFLFPPTCVLCGDAGRGDMDLCCACYRSLPFTQTTCQCCGVPLSEQVGVTREMICGRCLQDPPCFDRVLTPLRYETPVDWLVQRLKFNGNLSHVRVLGQLLLDYLELLSIERPQVIIPVPLHANRLQQRGFNQALELARPLARHLKLSLNTDLCWRRKDTPQQSELSSAQRKKNMRNAFCAQQNRQIKHVAIIDDVVTTGATVNAVAKLLKQNGVETVQVWAVARTPPFNNN